MENHQLINNRQKSRYEYHIGELRPHVEYRIKDNVIAITHTRIPSEIQGEGIGSALVKDCLDDIASQGMEVIPLCGFVASYINKHPQYKKLVAEGIAIG